MLMIVLVNQSYLRMNQVANYNLQQI